MITIPDTPPIPTEVVTYGDMTCPARVERIGVGLNATTTNPDSATLFFEDSY